MLAVSGSDPAPRLASSRPKIRQDSDMPEYRSPQASKSICPSSLMSRMYSVASTIPSAPIGTLM
jgi:hypothetical protein